MGVKYRKPTAAERKRIEELQKERSALVGQISECMEALREELNDVDRADLQQECDSLIAERTVIDNKLKELEQIFGELNTLRKRKAANDERSIIMQAIQDYHMAYLLDEGKFIYCVNMADNQSSNIVNPIFKVVNAARIVAVLNKLCGRQLESDMDSIVAMFQSVNRDYHGITGSFNREKWDSINKVYNKLEVIRNFWVKPVIDLNAAGEQQYDPRFDILLACVGGKTENMDHLERWVAYKYMYPERNANIPNIDLGGFPGGNGKNTWVNMLKTIFTNQCIVSATMKELDDGFNASWEFAVILHFDEPTSRELPDGKIKKATGADEQRIEKKGVDAHPADRNYNLIFTSNNALGVVKLHGTGMGGEDRRYSVVTTDAVMVDVLMQDPRYPTMELAKTAAADIAELVKNRYEVGRFLAHIIRKHNTAQMKVLEPLHGEDYRRRFNDRKSDLELVFDAMIPILKDRGALPYDAIAAIVNGLVDDTKLGPRAIMDKFERHLQSCKLNYSRVKNVRLNHYFNGELSDTDVQCSFFKLHGYETYGIDYGHFSRRSYMRSQKLNSMDVTLTV